VAISARPLSTGVDRRPRPRARRIVPVLLPRPRHESLPRGETCRRPGPRPRRSRSSRAGSRTGCSPA